MTPSKLEDIEHAIEKAAAVALVEVRDDEIIVTMPGTSYAVTYCKPANSSQLSALKSSDPPNRSACYQQTTTPPTRAHPQP